MRCVRWFLFAGSFIFLTTACSTNRQDDRSWPAGQHLITALSEAINHELQDKQIPAMSIALVKDQDLLWSEGFGYEDPEREIPATSQTTYRIGSVSKLFTDIAIMQQVERGRIDLDTPVNTYLPQFDPTNHYSKPITLRQLMSHHSGLVREPPIGNYFDDTGPSLKATVESLTGDQLRMAPETKIKYSNAGIAVVGYTLEYLHETPFARYLADAVLKPIGMEKSAFEPTAVVTNNLAKADMWTYDGRIWDAPTFELGMAPAGSMYASVDELALFVKTLLNDGVTPKGEVLLKPETLAAMWEPQYAEPGAQTGYGIGFRIDNFEGQRRVGHGGAIYGFSTQLTVLPEAGLGVIATSSMDVTNNVVQRIVNYALQSLLALEKQEEIPGYQVTERIPDSIRHAMTGRYYHEQSNQFVEVTEDGGDSYMWVGGSRIRMRMLTEDTMTFDGRLGFGAKMLLNDNGSMNLGGAAFERITEEPAPLPQQWNEYLGEYGWDHSVLYILERNGMLCALIEWIELDPLTEVETDVFNFPNAGMYHDEQVRFIRNEQGRVEGLEAAGIFFPRRDVGTEAGVTFTINPVKPVEKLRADALAASPPIEENKRPMDLVELSDLHPDIRYDIRYATTNNFMQSVFYKSAHAYLQKPAAAALLVALEKLRKQGYGLLIHDAYRPWYVTKMFWDATPEEFKQFVANPDNGSRHNRGCAVDLTLYDLETGEVVEMVGGYDEFSPRSYPAYPGGTSQQRYLRTILRQAMESSGFSVYQWEWWHFDYVDWREYPIGNLTFEELEN